MVFDPERQYGAFGFVDLLGNAPALLETPYARTLTGFLADDPPVCPGSAAQAMELLGDSATYLLCDVDPVSAQTLRQWAARRGIQGCRVAEEDGMSTVRDWLRHSDDRTVVHVDPFEPFACEHNGPSAVQLAADIASGGHCLVYWYGYSHPADRAWAFTEIGRLTDAPLCCGDFLLTTLDGETFDDGDLGEATTPGTGSGRSARKTSPAALPARCQGLARALAQRYDPEP